MNETLPVQAVRVLGSEHATSLRDADLKGAILESVDLSGVDLRGADLRCANLRGANLAHSRLNEVDLRGADLENAVLTGADLRGAQLSTPEQVADVIDRSRFDMTAQMEDTTVDKSLSERNQVVTQRVFLRETDAFWRVWFAADRAILPNRKGLSYIHHLLLREGEWVPDINLLALTDPAEAEAEERNIAETGAALRDTSRILRESITRLQNQYSERHSTEYEIGLEHYANELRNTTLQIRRLRKKSYARISNSVRRAMELLRAYAPKLANHLDQHIQYRSNEWRYVGVDQLAPWTLF